MTPGCISLRAVRPDRAGAGVNALVMVGLVVFAFVVKFGTAGERRSPLDQMKTVVNVPINRTVCELTGTKSARRCR